MSSAGRRVAVRLGIEGAEEVRQALTKLGADGEAALKRLNFDTSSSTGSKFLTATLEEGRIAAASYTSQLGPLGAILGSLGGGFLAAGAAVGAFAGLTYEAVKAGDEQAVSQARIASVLKATGEASGLTGAQIEEMSKRISESTLQTRDAVRDAAAELLTFRNIGPDSFERTLSLATDMAAVFKTDLAEAAFKLGRAIDDPIQGMNSLRRAGLDLSPAQKEIIANFEKTGDLADAQKALLDDLAAKVGGAGAGQNQGLAGAAHSAGVAWHDFLLELDATTGASDIVTKGLNAIAAALHAANSPDAKNNWLAALGGAPDLELYVPNAPTANFPMDRAPGGKPAIYDPDAFLGPSRAQAERNDETARALSQFAAALDRQAGGTTELQRYVDAKLEEAAKQQNLAVDGPGGLKARFPKQAAAIAEGATADFNASHTKQSSEEAAKQQNDLAEQRLYLDQLATQEAKAFAASTDAENKYQFDLLRGQEGYFAASNKAIDAWAAAQIAVADAEGKAQLGALENKRKAYEKDGVAFAGYEQAKTEIANTEADKRAAIASEENARRLALEREQQGALFPLIKKGSEDTNLALKQISADGLKSLEDGLVAAITSSKNFGQAFQQMGQLILEELMRMVLEKYVISQLAGGLNSIIDSLGSGGGAGGGGGGGILSGIGSAIGSLFGAANGAVFDNGAVAAFADGGIISGPVIAPMALMGEAGPEAIMPLKKGSDGKLGVAGGGGSVVIHHNTTFVIGGTVSQDDLARVEQASNDEHARFAQKFFTTYREAKSRKVI